MTTPLNVDTSAGQVTLDGDGPYVVGRGREADVTIDDSRISRRHLVLQPGPDGWVARDTSANGVWRDGEKVEVVPVDGEVRLRLGATDGPTVVLAAAGAPRPSAGPGEQTLLATAETRLAGPGPSATERARVEPEPRPPSAGPAAAEQRPSSAARWVRLVPTLVWLAATGFAIGALVALS